MPETIYIYNIRNQFLYFLYFYTSPTAIFLTVQWMSIKMANWTSTAPSSFPPALVSASKASLSAGITSTTSSFQTAASSLPTATAAIPEYIVDSSASMLESLSTTPYIWASLAAVLFILFGPITDYLNMFVVPKPKYSDPVLILFSISHLHLLIFLIFSKIYSFPSWILLPIAILSYPVTHAIMHTQFAALDMLECLGYFGFVSALFERASGGRMCGTGTWFGRGANTMYRWVGEDEPETQV